MSGHRLPQLNELIQQELGKIFLKEIEFAPGCLATITGVQTTKDLEQTKVSISILPAEQQEKIMALLTKKAGYFQFLLGKVLVIRKIPKIVFVANTSEQYASRIDELLDNIQHER